MPSHSIRVAGKTGRNEACPCGSGKKYKHCCLKDEPPSQDSLWRRQHEASDLLSHEMMRFGAREFGAELQDAWREFNLSDQVEPYVAGSEAGQIFMPFLLFDWEPDGSSIRKHGEGGMIARSYLQENEKRMTEMERLLFEQAITQPVTFYEVLSSVPGEGLTLVDALLVGTTTGAPEIMVTERSASRLLRAGDILYGQLCRLTGLTTLGRCAGTALPPRHKAEVVELRKRLRGRLARRKRPMDEADLVRYRDEIRATYLDILAEMSAPPRFCNTDGDPIAFHTLTFRIESAQVAFDVLAPLAWGVEKEDLLQDAEIDADGAFRKIKFDWIKAGNKKFETWDNTIMGQLEIEGLTLTADVNSQKRAALLRAEIERRMGRMAVHLSTASRTTEEALNSGREKLRPRGQAVKEDDEDEADAEIKDLMRDPEVRERMQAEIQKEVEAWIDRKLPVLHGKTPRQAMRTPEGREIVESLLLDWERKLEGPPLSPGNIVPDISVLRGLLGLEK